METEQEERREERPIQALLFTLIALIVESAILLQSIMNQLSLIDALTIHFSLTLLLLIWVRISYKKELALKLPIYSTISTGFLGFPGAFMALFGIVIYLKQAKTSINFIDWLSNLFPEEKKSDGDLLYQRLEAGWDDFSEKKQLMTFIDVMTFGTVSQKRVALTKISRYFRREFAPALAQALDDPSNAIRVQAATVMAKVEQDYMSTYMEQTRRYAADTEDTKCLLKIAKIADSYAYSGILAPDQEKKFRAIAIEHYEKYLEKVYKKTKREDPKVVFALCRLYLQEKMADKAEPLLRRCVEKDRYQSLNLGLWYMESLYLLQKFDLLEEVAKRYCEENPSTSSNQDLMQQIAFWFREHPESEMKLHDEPITNNQ